METTPVIPTVINLAAENKYALFKSTDPFPKIDAALLSSADIRDYAHHTAMIEPFDEDFLKPATYALTAGGPYMYWQDGLKYDGILQKGEYLTLKKDSILFITLEPVIQLPNYIAARFNLTIDHVYRGLLLGTGPMVEPGFVGQISIPLHNFTSNDYLIRGGEKLVWMEFTKLARNAAWGRVEQENERSKHVAVFPDKNKRRKLKDYIFGADKRSIESSIPLSVIKSEASAKAAEQSVKSAENFVKITVSINLAVIVAVMAFMWNVYVTTKSFYRDAKDDITQVQKDAVDKKYFELQKLQEDLFRRREIELVNNTLKVNRLDKKIDSLSRVISKLRK